MRLLHHSPHPLPLLPLLLLRKSVTSLSSSSRPSSPHSITNLLCSSCHDIRSLQKLHTLLIVSSEINSDIALSKLINLYSRFLHPSTALTVFNISKNPGTVTWNSIMKAHLDSHMASTVLSLYRSMRSHGIPHDSFTLPILNSAAAALVLQPGAPLLLVLLLLSSFCIATRTGFLSDLYFSNTLISSFVRSGFLPFARQVFDEMPITDAVSWTLIISGYADHGSVHRCFGLFGEMLKRVGLNPVAFIIMLQPCFDSEAAGGGIGCEIHGVLVKTGMVGDVSVKNSLMGMYSRSGCIEEVEQFLHEIPSFDVISWNILISHYSFMGDSEKVAHIFTRMTISGFNPNSQTVTLVISSCTSTRDHSSARVIHCFSLKHGVDDTIFLTSLLHCYSHLGLISACARLFSEMGDESRRVTWGAMVSAFARNGCFHEAFDLFRRWQRAGSFAGPDTMNSIALSCSSLGTLLAGKEVHGHGLRRLFLSAGVKGTALVTSLLNMYMRCGCVKYARELFEQMGERDTIAWTSMIEGCGSHGFTEEAFQLFDRMVEDGCRPNRATFLSLLSACSHSGRVIDGCRVFSTMESKFGVDPELDHITCMVDMFGRYGDVVAALGIITKAQAGADVDDRIWGALLGGAVSKEEWRMGEFAAKRLMELEPYSMGHLAVFSNLMSSVGRWGEAEKLRDMSDVKKEPARSYVEAGGGLHGFVCCDGSHPEALHIYQVLADLSAKVAEFMPLNL